MFRKLALALVFIWQGIAYATFDFEAFDRYVEQAMVAWETPGVAIAIVQDGQIVHLKVFGVADVQSQAPLTPETVFPLASLTKTFTSALMARLVDAGLIQWDDPVRQYLPDFHLFNENDADQFTIRDLLAHRSGLPGYAFDSLVSLLWSEEEVYQKLSMIAPIYEFHKVYTYQNIFPGIAGRVIERVTGMSLSEAYEAYLFQPLAFTHTSIGENGVSPKMGYWARIRHYWKRYRESWVSQHHLVDGKAAVIQGGNPALYCFNSSRGMNASIADMARWLLYQTEAGQERNIAFISPENILEMRTPHIAVGTPEGGQLFPKERVTHIDYGLGWFIHDYAGIQVFSHMGGMAGARTLMFFIPEKKVGMVILTNLGGMRVSLLPEALRSEFLDRFLQLEDSYDWSAKLKEKMLENRKRYQQHREENRLLNLQPRASLQDYVGTYHNALYGEVEVRRTVSSSTHSESLLLLYRGKEAMLSHWNGNHFIFSPHELSPAFTASDFGDVLFDRSSHHGKMQKLRMNICDEAAQPYFIRVGA